VLSSVTQHTKVINLLHGKRRLNRSTYQTVSRLAYIRRRKANHVPVADPAGGATVPPKTSVAPIDINALLFGAYSS